MTAEVGSIEAEKGNRSIVVTWPIDFSDMPEGVTELKRAGASPCCGSDYSLKKEDARKGWGEKKDRIKIDCVIPQVPIYSCVCGRMREIHPLARLKIFYTIRHLIGYVEKADPQELEKLREQGILKPEEIDTIEELVSILEEELVQRKKARTERLKKKRKTVPN
jgi:hypothetical protein